MSSISRRKFPLFFKAAAFGVFVIVGTAMVVYFIMRQRADVISTPKGDFTLSRQMVAVAENFRNLYTENGREIFLLTAERDETFTDGHHSLYGVRLESYIRGPETKDVIVADEAIYDQARAYAQFQKNVVVTFSDGSTIKTNSAHYDQANKIVTSDDVIEFERQGITGSFKGVVFDTAKTNIVMQQEVTIRIAGAPGSNGGSEPVVIRAGAGEYDRGSSRLQFTGRVTVTRGTDQMSADRMIAHLTGDNKVTRLEARANASLKLAEPGKAFELKSRDMDFFLTANQHLERAKAVGGVVANSLDEGPRRSVTTDAMELTFIPGRSSLLRQLNTTGVTRALFTSPAADKQPAERELVANQTQLNFRENGRDLQTATASGDAALTVTPLTKDARAERKRLTADRFTLTFFEMGNLIQTGVAQGNARVTMEALNGSRPPRTTTSQTVTANFDRATQDVTEVIQEGNFKFTEGDRNATAGRAVYRLTENLIQLLGTEPTIWDSAARTQAEEISINLQTGKSQALRRVRTTYYTRDKVGGAAPFTNMRAPVFITAQKLEVDNEATQAIYTGQARAWQGDNFVAADKLVLLRQDRQLLAEGHVSSALSQIKRSEKSQKAAVPVFARAERLTFSDTAHRLRYEGNVEVKQGTDTLVAQSLDVLLEPGTNEVSKILAENGVTMTQPGRRGTGDRVEYNTKTNTVILTGNLARVEDAARGLTTGRQLTFSMSDDKVSIEDQRGARRGQAVYKSQ